MVSAYIRDSLSLFQLTIIKNFGQFLNRSVWAIGYYVASGVIGWQLLYTVCGYMVREVNAT